jgi:hypothetical protein
MKDIERLDKKYWIVLVIGIIAAIAGLKFIQGNTNQNTNIITPIGLDKEFFSKLPAKPNDFLTIQKLRESGIIEDNPERIDEKYWKQVDWMANGNLYIDAASNCNPNYTPLWCAGIYDAQMVFRIENIGSLENNTIYDGRFWIRNIPCSRADFGIRLVPDYPMTKKLIGNIEFNANERIVTQDILTAMKYIKMKVMKVCDDSKNCVDGDTFLLGSTHPTLSYDYVKEVWFEIEIDRNIPKGWYVVSLNAVSPSKQFTSDQVWQHLDMKKDYKDPNLGQACGVPEFDFFVEVT